MKIKYEFDLNTVQVIAAALTKAPLPWEVTNPVIKYLEEEGNKQIQEQQNPVVKEVEE